jgi:hypothetical protein
MRKLFMLLLSAGLITTTGFAQKISGIIKDQQGNGLEKATVTLLRAKDSSAVKFGATDKSGAYSFDIAEGAYIVSATRVGYLPIYSSPVEVAGGASVTAPTLSMAKAEKTMQGVVVSSKKPMVEVKADKTILNVEGTINSTGSDALELLRKAPGVTIDKDDNISLAGKNGVQIYVDGKQTPLSGADLTAYLKTLQAAQIESIEMITNPSAKYEAAGNAGIINIRLKKNKAFGTNGSVNAGYNMGYFPKYNAGISLNNRNKKINLFGNYNYANSTYRNNFELYRKYNDSTYDTKNVMTNKNQNNGFKGGLDYFVNSRTTVGAMVNGNFATTDFQSEGKTIISYDPTKTVAHILNASNTNDQQRNNMNVNLNYRYADTSGRELNLDADYGFFRLKGNQLQPNFDYEADGVTPIGQEINRSISPTNIDIYTLKGDYEQGFKKGRLGIGFKTSIIQTDNRFLWYDIPQMKPEIRDFIDTASNQFKYRENINAGYVNYNKQFKGFMIQIGVRVENTTSKGDSYGYNPDGTVNKNDKQSFERKYTDVFPSGAITFNKKPMSQWGFSYSRRIDRPAYQDLNPFVFRLDKYTYMKGNTDLRPQYTNIVSLTNTYKYRLTTTLSYSHVSDVFVQLPDVTPEGAGYLTKKNLADQDVVNLSVSYPYQYKSYSVFANFNGNYSHYQADLGGPDRQVDLEVFAFNIFMQHSLKIGKKGWTTELSGWYNSPSVWGGTFKSKALWSVDAGVQKTILKGKGTFKLSATDLFYSIRWKGESDFSGQQLIARGYGESRQLRANLSWRFGSNTVKAARQRKSGLDDESKRTQSSGGIGQ